MSTLYVIDMPEFKPILDGVRNAGGVAVSGPAKGYWQVEGTPEIVLSRKALGLKVALWNSCLAGGYIGKLEQFDRDQIRIAD